MSENADIKSIAKRAGLSVGTVSMALNDNPLVKAATRERVRAVAAEMGYVPNIIAQIVSSRHNRAVGIVLPNSTPDFFGCALHGLMRRFEKADQHAFSVYGQDRPENELYYLRIFAQLRLRGLVMAPCPGSQSKPLIQRLIDSGTKVVFLDRLMPGIEGDFVGINYQDAARIAAERLIGAGHRRIGVIVGSPMFSNISERVTGLRAAMDASGIPFEKDLTLRLDYENDYNFDRIDSVNCGRLREFLLEQKPTALFLAMDGNLMTVQRVCESLGWKVPEHLNLVVFSEPKPHATRRHNFLYVTCPIEEAGSVAGRILLERFREDPPKTQRIRLPADVWPEITSGPAARRPSAA